MRLLFMGTPHYVVPVLQSLAAAPDVQVVAGTTELEVVEPGRIEVSIEVTGLEAGAEIVGGVDLTLGNITIETVDGQGTGEIVLSEGLKVVGDVTLVAEDGALTIVFEDIRLIVEPEAPDVELLLGGSADVTHINVTFDVGLENLPEGASLEIEFAKSADAFLEDAGVIFQLAAEQIFVLVASEQVLVLCRERVVGPRRINRWRRHRFDGRRRRAVKKPRVGAVPTHLLHQPRQRVLLETLQARFHGPFNFAWNVVELLRPNTDLG